MEKMNNLIVITLLVAVAVVVLLCTRFHYRRKYGSVIDNVKVKTDDAEVMADDAEDKTGDAEVKTDDAEDTRQQPLSVNADTVNNSELELFQQLTDTIRKEHLYLTPKLGRQDLMNHFHLSKERVGAAFSAGGTSVPEFIRECRLEHARRLMTEHPTMPLTDVAKASGFIHASTFTVDFKNKFGVSPTQYREKAVNENNI